MLIKMFQIACVFVVAACAAPGLTGATWILQSLDGSNANVSGYTLRCPADTSASFHMQCNTCGYTYRLTDTTVAFSKGFCTLMACQSDTREAEFIEAVGKVIKWEIRATRLFFMSAADTLMVFKDSVASKLSGTSWVLRAIEQGAGPVVPSNVKDYTMKFFDNGVIEARVDCNTCNSFYSENPGASLLAFGAVVCTKMYCGPNSKDMLYTAVIKGINRYAIAVDTLRCFGDTDTLVFDRSTVKTQPVAPNTPTAGFVRLVVNRHSMTIRLPDRACFSARLIDARGACVSRRDASSTDRLDIRTDGLPAGVYQVWVAFATGAVKRAAVCIIH